MEGLGGRLLTLGQGKPGRGFGEVLCGLEMRSLQELAVV